MKVELYSLRFQESRFVHTCVESVMARSRLDLKTTNGRQMDIELFFFLVKLKHARKVQACAPGIFEYQRAMSAFTVLHWRPG